MPVHFSTGLIASDGALLKAPTADGSTGQSVVTDGAGQLSFADVESAIEGNSTAAAPGLPVVGDSDTGLFSDMADTLSASVGGVEGLRVVESGGVVTWPMTRLPIISNDPDEPDSIAIGAGTSLASGDPGGQDVVIGVNAKSTGTAGSWNRRVAIGFNAEARVTGDVAIGANSAAKGGRSIAIGRGATTDATRSIVIGEGSTSNGGLMGIGGTGANAQHDQAMAFGAGVNTIKDFEVVFGSRFAAAVAPSIRLSGSTDAFTGRSLTELDSEWVDVNDSTRKARAVHRVWDTAAREVMRMESDGSNGYLIQKAHATAPADAMLPNASVAFYEDGSGNLAVKLKNASGTVTTGTVSLA